MSDNTSLTPLFDQWLKALPEVEFVTQRDAYKEEVAQLQAERDALDLRLTEKQAALSALEAALELRSRWMNRPTAVDGRASRGGEVAHQTGKRLRGRSAVLRLMNEAGSGRHWATRDVVDMLARVDWAEPADEGAVAMTLSRLARSNEIRRVRPGVYALPE